MRYICFVAGMLLVCLMDLGLLVHGKYSGLYDADKPTEPITQAPDISGEPVTQPVTRAEFEALTRRVVALEAEAAVAKGQRETLAARKYVVNVPKDVRPIHIHEKAYPAQTIRVDLHAQFDDGKALVQIGDKLPNPLPAPATVQTVRQDGDTLTTSAVEDKGGE